MRELGKEIFVPVIPDFVLRDKTNPRHRRAFYPGGVTVTSLDKTVPLLRKRDHIDGEPVIYALAQPIEAIDDNAPSPHNLYARAGVQRIKSEGVGHVFANGDVEEAKGYGTGQITVYGNVRRAYADSNREPTDTTHVQVEGITSIADSSFGGRIGAQEVDIAISYTGTSQIIVEGNVRVGISIDGGKIVAQTVKEKVFKNSPLEAIQELGL